MGTTTEKEEFLRRIRGRGRPRQTEKFNADAGKKRGLLPLLNEGRTGGTLLRSEELAPGTDFIKNRRFRKKKAVTLT